MSKNLFITGTGTGIGKTYVTGLIVKKLQDNTVNSAYYKAAMSGNDRRADGVLIPGDALHVKTVSGIKQPLEEMCPYLYETAVSPHLAARIEGRPIHAVMRVPPVRLVPGIFVSAEHHLPLRACLKKGGDCAKATK